jgi:hypothetical protein
MNIMDEKPIEKKEVQPVVEKKAYKPPALTTYGKLTELTASGTGAKSENNPMGQPDKMT